MIIYPKKLLPNARQKAKAIKFANEILTFVLKDRRFKVDWGTYFTIVEQEIGSFGEETNVKKLLEVVKPAKMTCNVCAIGAFYAAKIKTENKVNLNNYSEYSSYYLSLNDYKRRRYYNLDDAPETMRKELGNFNAICIECTFEQSVSFYDYTDYPVEYRETGEAICMLGIDMYRKYDSRDRLRYICKNIIRNGGVFVPKGVVIE